MLFRSVRDQVVDDDVLRIGHVRNAHLDAGGLADAPRRREFGVEEDGTGQPYRPQHVRKRVQVLPLSVPASRA
mgnify:CR=1 FL=1